MTNKRRKQVMTTLEMCKKLNYKVTEKFGLIFVKTKTEEWYFDPNKKNIKLYHQNFIFQDRNYHVQPGTFTDAKEVIYYIRRHESWKYHVKIAAI